MHAFLEEMHGWYQQMTRLPPSTLRSLVNLGAGITKWLPGRSQAEIKSSSTKEVRFQPAFQAKGAK
jgi:hypothetical protein